MSAQQMVVFGDFVSKDHQDLIYKEDVGRRKAYINVRKQVDIHRSEIDLQQEDERDIAQPNLTSWYLLHWMPIH